MMERKSDDGLVQATSTVDESKPDHAPVARSPDERSDWELVNSVCGGDESGFEVLFERHKWRVSTIAGRFFSDHIEDIVQESFTRAYFALPNFSAEREGSLASWLSKIAFNTCYDELRRRGRRREAALNELSESETRAIKALSIGPANPSVETVAIDRDLAIKLLAHLSADDRLVLVLLYVEGLSVREIAEVTGWSAAKVKMRTFRARAHLRRILKRFL